MASLNATIDFLEKLPEDIRSHGEQIAKDCVSRNGHVDTGHMLEMTRAFAHGDEVQIVVWAKYAKFVNDGHGPSYPIKWKGVYIRPSYKWYGGWVHHTSGYAGSGFFDQAYVEILAYVNTL